jgi:hypothetical protein
VASVWPLHHKVWSASSRKSLGGSKLLPLKNDRGHCVLGDLQCCRISLSMEDFMQCYFQKYITNVDRMNSVSWHIHCGRQESL